MPSDGPVANGAHAATSGRALGPPAEAAADPAIVRAAKKPRLDCDGGWAGFPATVAARLCDYLASLGDRDEPVVRLAAPEALRAAFGAAGAGLVLADAAEGDGVCGAGVGGAQAAGRGLQSPTPPEALVEAIDLVLKYQVRTGHPLFFNQLYARADPVAIAADWVVTATNTNSFTYEVSPVYTLIEAETLRKIASCIGGAFADAHDGLFVPGGSISNLYAMHLAHHRANPDLATKGASGGPRCVAFTSDQSHYSYLKAAKVIGLGSDNLVSVRSDGRGRMLADELEVSILRAKADGALPFFVGSTAGTTVLGAYDPFDEISAVCARHGLWHHVDACWGGGALLSEKHRHAMAGASEADSLAWNPHKMSGAALQCSAFLNRHPGLLARVNGTSAAYLFQPDKLNASLDCGDKTIQCGRKADVFKLWALWKAKGDAGMARTVDACFALAAFMAGRLRADPSGQWALAYEPSCSNVCFWYVPRRLRPFSFAASTEAQRAELHGVAPHIKGEMQRRGDAMIGFQAANGRPNFFRMVFAHADAVREEDIVGLLGRMASIGESI